MSTKHKILPNKLNEKIHTYHPDFKVENTLIEIKGDQFFDETGKND